MKNKLAAQILGSGLVVEGRSQFLAGFLACFFAGLFVFAILFGFVECLGALAIAELFGILFA